MVDQNIKEVIKKRFAELPPSVQRAITSVDVQKKLREAADRHKLHLDQWEILENEVLMTLFGITPVDELQAAIQKEVGVSAEIAVELSADISRIVFEPIREELERELEHPEAKEKEMTGVETAREQVLGNQPKTDSASSFELRASTQQEQGLAGVQSSGNVSRSSQLAAYSSVMPATPPPPPPTEKATRAPSSGAYKAGEVSSARKDIHDDPYRESPA